MKKAEELAHQFLENRRHLRGVAYRMLGSVTEADDALQETWIRLSQSDTDSIDNLGGWLTTVVARVCLDMLRTRKVRKEEPIEKAPEKNIGTTPEEDAHLADSLASGLLIVLETLPPVERVAFVLHDIFDVSFDKIAPIVGRSEIATRQLASRARRRVKGNPEDARDQLRKQEVVAAFLKASREGDFTALLHLLDPEVLLRADEIAIQTSFANRDKGAPQFAAKIQGAQAIASLLKGKATGAQLASIDGAPGSTWIAGGKPRLVFAFTVSGEKISGIDVFMNPADLDEMDVKLIEQESK